MRFRFWLTAALAVGPVLGGHAQVPQWSVALTQAELRSDPPDINQATMLENGEAWLLGLVMQDDAYASLRIAADGALRRGQFEHGLLAGVDRTTVLASTGQRLLLRLEDGIEGASHLYLMDGDARRLWARSLPAEAARILADGDVILLSGLQLTRLRGLDGQLLWSRHLLEFHAYAQFASAAVASSVDGQLELALALGLDSPAGTATSHYVALDPADGTLRFQREVPGRRVPGRCAPVPIADFSVLAWLDWSLGPEGPKLVIERRRRSDGRLMWERQLARASIEDVCAFGGSGNRVYLAADDGEFLRVDALDATTGELRWQRRLPRSLSWKLQVHVGGDAFLSAVRWEGTGPVQTLSRLSGADGADLWTRPSAAIAWALGSDRLTLVLASGAQAELQHWDAGSGTMIDGHSASLVSWQAGVQSALIVDDSSCHAQLLGHQSVRVSCIDSIDGALKWTRELAPQSPMEALTHVSLVDLRAGKIGVDIAAGPAPGTTSDSRLLALRLEDGATAWDTPSRPADWWVAADGEGGAYGHHLACSTSPGCPDPDHLARYAGADGALVWSRPPAGLVRAADADTVLLTTQANGQFAWRAIEARSGAGRWNGTVFPGVVARPAALITTGGHLLVKQEPVGGGIRIELDALDPLGGTVRWSVRAGVPGSTSRGVLTALQDNEALLVGERQYVVDGASKSGPWLVRVDGATGAVRLELAPEGGAENRRSLRAIRAPVSGVDWLDSSREFSSSFQRRTLVRLPAARSIGVEHQYASGRFGPRHRFSELWPRASLADGSLVVEDWRGESNGVRVGQLRRWPAPAGPVADIRLELLTPTPVHAQGASTVVTVAVHSPVTTGGLRTGFTAEAGGLQARVVACEPIPACGEPDAEGDVAVGFATPGTVLLHWELFDEHYLPRGASIVSRGRFHVDLPYDLADPDFDNHGALLQIALGGTSSGFE